MPIYEYTCPACGNGFERRLKIEERLLAQPCPQCGEKRAALRMSAPSLVTGGAASEPLGHCPTSGRPCGCAHAIRD